MSASTFSDMNEDVGELNFQGHTETDNRNVKISSTGKHWQTTCRANSDKLEIHLGWSNMCFTALVGFIDSQMLRMVLCFFLLPGCLSALQIGSVTTMVLPAHTRAPLLALNALGACLDPSTLSGKQRHQNHCHPSNFAH